MFKNIEHKLSYKSNLGGNHKAIEFYLFFDSYYLSVDSYEHVAWHELSSLPQEIISSRDSSMTAYVRFVIFSSYHSEQIYS